MDNLARNCMLAKQAGMSYGKWKALQPIVPIEKKEVIPEDWKKCEYCGKQYMPYRKSQKYCEMYCQKEAYKEKVRQQKKAEKELKKLAAEE